MLNDVCYLSDVCIFTIMSSPGAGQSGVDQLSLELMVPLPQLKDCVDMVSDWGRQSITLI